MPRAVDANKRRWTVSPARAAQYEAERAAIVRAAYDLVGGGPDPISVQDILATTKLSTRAFYRHFSSKDELVVSMYRAETERVATALDDAVTTEPDPLVALAAWIDLILAVAFDPRRARHTRVLSSSEAKASPGFNRELVSSMDRCRQSLQRLVTLGTRKGVFNSHSPSADSFAIHGIAQAYIQQCLYSGRPITQKRAAGNVLAAAHQLLGVPSRYRAKGTRRPAKALPAGSFHAPASPAR